MTFTEYTGNRGPTDGPYRAGSDGPHDPERAGVGLDGALVKGLRNALWAAFDSSERLERCTRHDVSDLVKAIEPIVAAHVAEVERERDEWRDVSVGPAYAAVLRERAEQAVAEVAALRKQVEAVRAEHRREWADYIDQWDGAVGPEPPTARSIVAALRGAVPFGVTAALDAEAVDL